jgi:hypothetical protein
MMLSTKGGVAAGFQADREEIGFAAVLSQQRSTTLSLSGRNKIATSHKLRHPAYTNNS